MKIILICQAGTDMVWESRYDADSFERAIETERGCFAVGGSVRRIDASAYRVYTGTSRACMQTAEILFAVDRAKRGIRRSDGSKSWRTGWRQSQRTAS